MKNTEQETIFRRWMSEHLGLMLKVVRAYAETSHDQDDLLQNVLINLWSSMGGFRGEAKETTWIYRVAFNTALVWQRGEQRRRKKLNAYATSSQASPVTLRTSDELQNSEVIAKLYAAIRQLAKVDASLALMHLDGLSYHEMSEVLGISENYLGVKLNRIRNQLAEQLQGVFDEL